MTPIYGHTSPETAYVVDDYPYGFKLRCKIRYWLEHKPSKGWRFVSQTTNPKKGDRWNTPKVSTYSNVGACMFLNSIGHVEWTGVSAYSSVETLQAFADKFPGADLEQVNNLLALYAKRGASK